MHRPRLTAAVLGVFALLVAPCGDDDVGATEPSTTVPVTTAPVTSDPGTTEPGTTEPATTEPATFEERFADVINAAQEEGTLAFLGGASMTSDGRAFFDHFGEEFGIEISIFAGSTGDTVPRVLAEYDQGLRSFDIARAGGSAIDQLYESGVLEPMAPILEPEVLDWSDQTIWPTDEFPWLYEDKETCAAWSIGAEPNFMYLWYNTENVSQEDVDSVHSWHDLLDPRWKGRIGIGAINEDESAQNRIAAWQRLGEEWFYTLLVEQEPQVALYGEARDQADALARGEFDWVIFPAGGVEALQVAAEEGLPVATFPRTMDEGTSGEFMSRFCVFREQPHPNATKLFLNWVLSQEGMTAWNELSGEPDRPGVRRDVPQGNVTDTAWELINDDNFVIDDPLLDSPEYALAATESKEFVDETFIAAGLVPGG